ncbi:hypothetical protein ACFT9M_12380 [Micromonospora purpureochromogenes]|uniref:hypothetical protein n=1 Tax=Micromonospora purpureochromogenes TaxID=47872 RepID=UPI0036266E65
MNRRPGQYVGGVGTACLALGATIFVLTLATGAYGSEILFACVLLVISGLLLRIEAAVWAGRQDGNRS